MDPQAKKVALRAINYGLYVLTAADGDEFAAAGVNWLTQVSFEPPLVMVGVKADSDSHPVIGRTGRSPSTCWPTTSSTSARRSSARPRWRATRSTATASSRARHRRPLILVDLPYWFECRVTDTVARGDHTVFVAEVVEAGVRDESRPPLTCAPPA